MLVTPYRIIKTLASVNLEKQKYNPTRGREGRGEREGEEKGENKEDKVNTMYNMSSYLET